MKQTAVEFLIRELRIEDLAKSEQLSVVHHIINEAKEMEKQQIKQSYMSGQIDGVNQLAGLIDGMNQQPKGYYNETYEN